MSTPCGICTRLVGDGLPMCEVCGRTLVEALLAVPSLLADLETARTGQARIAEGRAGGRSAEAPLPIKDTSSEYRGRGVRLLGERDAVALSTALHGWARVLADHLGAEVPIESRSLAVLAANARHTGGSAEAPAIVHERRLRDGERVRDSHVARRTAAHLITPVQEDERLAVWLASHPHELRLLEAAEQAYHDIVNATGGLRRAIDRPADQRYLGRCPVVLDDGDPCAANLWAEPDATWARCPRCHVQHEVARIEAAATEAARDAVHDARAAARLRGRRLADRAPHRLPVGHRGPARASRVAHPHPGQCAHHRPARGRRGACLPRRRRPRAGAPRGRRAPRRRADRPCKIENALSWCYPRWHLQTATDDPTPESIR